MKAYFKLLIVGENASDIKSKAIELAHEFGDVMAVSAPAETGPAFAEPKFNLHNHATEVTPAVQSVGKAWTPVEGTNGFSGAEVTTEGTPLDSRNMPWDERIHQANQARKKDGTWMNKRGLEQSFLLEVEAELRGSAKPKTVPPFGSMPAEQYQQQVAQAAPSVQAPAFAAPAAMPSPVQMIAAIPVQAEAPAPVAVGIAGLHDVESFKRNLPTILMDLVVSQKITPQYIKTLTDHFKVANLVDVVKNAASTQALFDTFVQYKFINSGV